MPGVAASAGGRVAKVPFVAGTGICLLVRGRHRARNTEPARSRQFCAVVQVFEHDRTGQDGKSAKDP